MTRAAVASIKLALAALALSALSAPALAGPPYLTDDPVPTDAGHWEIYAFTVGDGRGSTFDAEAGNDLNYGAAKGGQLTATLPLSLSHDPADGWRTGTGDVELAVKYRFFNDQDAGLSAAIFPRAILPTSGIERHERVKLLLPLWVEKDFAGGTSLFGGGGYEVNPGRGNRDLWQAGATLTHDVSDKVSVGAEITRQGAIPPGPLRRRAPALARSSNYRTIMPWSSPADRPGPSTEPAITSTRRLG